MRKRLVGLMREPALHFIVLGAALFGLQRAARPADVGPQVLVTRDYLEQMRAQHLRHFGRPPAASEERELVDQFIDDEVLYREALRLGLDRGDPIVRRRLIQKMQFLAEDLAPSPPIGDDDLRAFVAAHGDRYREPARVSLRHVFFSRDLHGTQALAFATRAAAARAPIGKGDPFLLGDRLIARSQSELEGLLGANFAAQSFALPVGQWSGPIASSYGFHLVRVEERIASHLPPLVEIASRARQDLLEQRRQASNRAALAKLRQRYAVKTR